MAKKTSGRQRLLIPFSVLGLATSLYALKTLKDSGAFTAIWDHPLADCHLVKGVIGAEDMGAFSTSQVVISSTDREHHNPSSRNGLYLYNMNVRDGTPRLITPDLKGEPHGLSLWKSDEAKRIFVIVHHPDADDQVLIYDLEGSDLKFVKTVEFPGLKTLNGIIALDKERFFVSQDLGFTSPFGQALEKYLRRPFGKVFYYDGNETHVAAENILYANGLELAPDRKTLYVASMLGQSLLLFNHDDSTHSLALRETVYLGTAPDNIHLTPDDRLLVGTHPKLLDLKAHAQDPLGHRAPAQLLSVSLDGNSIEELYSSRGQPLSAISAGIQVSDRILMGAIFDDGILNCAK
ncbi:MAG: SMP-30/gluconolactonase/LRE family protein [Chitinophagaceae bacterium]|nr:SMP-30/gluconolactonase/LRE family protein [Oligoflexus sp.]